MYCRICGDETNVKFYPSKRQALCPHCAKDTPAKIGREQFDKRYWSDSDDVNESIKREFYADYLASEHAYDEYVKATVSYA